MRLMGTRGAFRFVAAAAALLAAGAAGLLVMRGPGAGPAPRDPPSRPRGSPAPREGEPLRIADPSPEDGDPSSPPGADGSASRGAGEGALPAGTAAALAAGEGTAAGAGPAPFQLTDVVVFWPGTDLPSSPALDPATGDAPAVEAGRPPEMALSAFVEARGSVAKAAELVGDRRPELEEGVPVSITGRVLEADGGAPVVGATVLLTSTFYVRRYFYDHHLREVARAETDADGNYGIERLNVDPAHFGKGGRLHLTVTAPDHAPALAVPLSSVTPGIANRLRDVALDAAPETVAGRVLDFEAGLPVVGARILATGAIDPVSYPKDERPALFVGAPETVTDAGGRFTLTGLGRGVQFLSAHGGDDCLGREAVMLPRGTEGVLRVRAIRGRIEGTTVDAEGNPVALVTVEGGGNSTHSFADGRFTLENFRGDAVTIRFTHPDFPPVVLRDVKDGTAGLVVAMERPRPRIVLEVRDRDTGEPVPRIRTELLYEEGAERPAATSPERLAADGRYPLRVPAGAVGIRVAADGGRTAEVSFAGRVEEEVVPVLLAPGE